MLPGQGLSVAVSLSLLSDHFYDTAHINAVIVLRCFCCVRMKRLS